MIVYQADKREFLFDNDHHDIEQVVHERYQAATGRKVGQSELGSWRDSLNALAKVLRDEEIPNDLGVAVEFILPQSSKRIDVTLAGIDAEGRGRAVVVELKRWTEAQATSSDGMVVTRLGGAERATVHPSYQAWSYAAFLEGFNEAVYEGGIGLHPCAYLHNFAHSGVLDAPQYHAYVEKAPLFLKGEADRERLRAFIKQHVKHGAGKAVLYKLENGRIRPSKGLADSISKLLKGNAEFTLIDDQKEVFEAARAAIRQATESSPRVVIIEGGPGTGKSVVAVNLLAALKDGLNVKYVSRNAAPREVYSHRLGGRGNAHLRNLFAGSGAFVNSPHGAFDALIVDEAHRLTEKSGFYGNEGDHQIKEIIRAASCAVFFIDEDQRVTLKDVGSKQLIRDYAEMRGAHVEEHSLRSQFRCAGSDGYLAWLDNTLAIRETANPTLDGIDYDFQVFDDVTAMHEAVQAKNHGNRARVVAGYCWDWKSKKNSGAVDIVIGSYRRQWNLTDDGSLWLIAPKSVDQVGCIHTCQGLELDYIGVIIGPDLVSAGASLEPVPGGRARHDKTMKGYAGMAKRDPIAAKAQADAIIRNTYRTLMTRGMKGCFVYATDLGVRDYLRSRIGSKASVADFKTA
ncbi:DNA/RNA helicase domain-containing protein [Ramlibacter sp. AN1015]|uniref:DNA/RNA helicase domain-containing protein n=1 Tax=Ramlibacter sp. AN1015 TaxID=3133428 RepID=UPI0030C54218